MGIIQRLGHIYNYESKMDNAKELFKKAFGFTPFHFTRSPGVVELLGGFSTIYDGLSLTVPITKGVEIAASPRTDGKVEVVFSDSPHEISSFRVSNKEHDLNPLYENYLKSLIAKLHSRGAPVGGFSSAVFSSLPLSNFLGIVPSYLIAMTLTLRKLYPFRLTETGTMLHPPKRDKYGIVEPPTKNEKIAIGGICTEVGKEFSVYNSCLIPGLTCLFGKKYHAICIDCRHKSFELIPMFGEIAIVVFRIKNTIQYDPSYLQSLFSLSEASMRCLSVKTLRSIDMEFLKSRKRLLPQQQYDFAYYIIGEIQRVIFGERALEDGDFEQFGQYMIFSHESSRDLLHITPLETEGLFQISINHKGCFGARMICNEYRNSIVSLVRADCYQEFIQDVATQFRHLSGLEIEAIVCVTSNCSE